MSWNYSRALVEEYLDTLSTDTGRSALSKLILIADMFLSRGKIKGFSRPFRFGTTCVPLRENLGRELSTLFRAGFRAKTSVRPATEPGSPVKNPPSGLRCSGSFGRFDRVTSSWRTPIDLFGEDSTLCSKVWPKAGTMRNGVCYPREPLAPRIFENGAGCWVGTPTCRDTKRSTKFADGRKPSPGEMVENFPSPKTSDATRGDCPCERNRKSPSLVSAVKMIPTPTTKGLDGGSHSRAAAKKRGTWITPSASDATRGGKITKNMTGASLVQQINTPDHWPTPKANDAEKRGQFANDPRNGLPAAVKSLPTPTAQDAKCCGSSLQQNRNTPPLNAVVKMLPTPLASDHKYRLQGNSQQSNSLGALAARTGEGQLNPDWVEWLMGWPLLWTDLDSSIGAAAIDTQVRFWFEYQSVWFDEEAGAPYQDSGFREWIERTTAVTKNRVNRLRALGNGQVPRCAATAFLLLFLRMEER